MTLFSHVTTKYPRYSPEKDPTQSLVYKFTLLLGIFARSSRRVDSNRAPLRLESRPDGTNSRWRWATRSWRPRAHPFDRERRSARSPDKGRGGVSLTSRSVTFGDTRLARSCPNGSMSEEERRRKIQWSVWCYRAAA